MATSRSRSGTQRSTGSAPARSRRQARQDEAERAVGPAVVDGVNKMRQTPDSRAGVTAVLYMGERYPTWAALYEAHPEARDHAKGKRGTVGPGRDREALWPEMATAPTRAANAAAAAGDPELEVDDDPGTAGEGGGAGEGEAGGSGRGDGYTAEDLADVSTEDLAQIAEAKGITVKGARGRKPSRKHYLDALIGK